MPLQPVQAPQQDHAAQQDQAVQSEQSVQPEQGTQPEHTLRPEQSCDLTAHNTLGLQAVAPRLVRYRSPDQLAAVSRLAKQADRVFVLGGGSNVVLAPSLSSLVIKVESSGVRLIDETADYRIVEAEAGESWHGFVSYCVQQGWGGLENLALIPGTVGAAPVQNIGAYGVELDQRLHSLDAWDLHRERLIPFRPDECQFAYRDSLFKRAGQGRWLILRVRFVLPADWSPVLRYPDLQRHPQLAARAGKVTPRDIFDAVCEIRRSKLPDPEVLANAGSFFKNPVVDAATFERLQVRWPDVVAFALDDGSWKLAAGWLIEQAGWKGRRLGPVGMHDRQALVLVNHGGARAGDVAALARRVRDDVRQQFGVSLEQEPVTVR